LTAKTPLKPRTERSEADKSGDEKNLSLDALFPALQAAPAANAAPVVDLPIKP
jgi:hypothetical protein